MKFYCIFLILVVIIISLLIIYFSLYNKLIIYKIKIDISDDNISSLLKQKKKKMEDLIVIIQKIIKKKNYFKEFTSNKNNKLNNIDYDKFLNEHYLTMLTLKEDNKSLNKAEANKLFLELNLINQNLIANKKFFNKSNNELMKQLRGCCAKIVSKINNITVKNSYELKEPKDSSL